MDVSAFLNTYKPYVAIAVCKTKNRGRFATFPMPSGFLLSQTFSKPHSNGAV